MRQGGQENYDEKENYETAKGSHNWMPHLRMNHLKTCTGSREEGNDPSSALLKKYWCGKVIEILKFEVDEECV